MENILRKYWKMKIFSTTPVILISYFKSIAVNPFEAINHVNFMPTYCEQYVSSNDGLLVHMISWKQ